MLLLILNFSSLDNTIPGSFFFLLKNHNIFNFFSNSHSLLITTNFFIFFFSAAAFIFLLNLRYNFNYKYIEQLNRIDFFFILFVCLFLNKY